MHPDIAKTIVIFCLFPAVFDDCAWLNRRHCEGNRLFCAFARADQIPPIDRLAVQFNHAAIRFYRSPLHALDGPWFAINQVDLRSFRLALLVKHFDAGIIVENAPEKKRYLRAVDLIRARAR